MAAQIDPLDFQWSLSLLNLPVDVGQSLDVQFTFQIKNPKITSQLKDTHIYYDGGDKKYFQANKQLLQNSNFPNVRMRLEAVSSAIEDTIPSQLTFRLRGSGNQVITTKSWTLSVRDFAGSLYPKSGDDAPRNIFIFGLAGSTKSSFINSAYSLLSSDVQKGIAVAGGHSERVTTELKSYKLVNLDEQKATNYRFWDTWGLERKNYEGCEFTNIIQGKASAGWTMAQATKSRVGDLVKVPAESKNIQNCVIFFIPAAELDTDGSELLQKTREFMESATEHQVATVLVITKIDVLVPSARQNPNAHNPGIQSRISKACKFFNLPPARVFPLVNYNDETQKNFEIDRLILKVLRTSCQIADSHVQVHPNTFKSPKDKRIFDMING